jgi:predicted transcriptional regulator of viral defense system
MYTTGMGIRTLEDQLYHLAQNRKYIYTSSELALLLPSRTPGALRTIISRYVSMELLIRLASGIILYKRHSLTTNEILYTTARLLRRDSLMYLSLESALSEYGCISQVPMTTVTFMTTGRSGKFVIADFGTIEFIHTKRRPHKILPHLIFDEHRGCYIAHRDLAIADQKRVGRNLDLLISA